MLLINNKDNNIIINERKLSKSIILFKVKTNIIKNNNRK